MLRSRQAAGLSSQQCTISKVVHIEKSGVRLEPSQTKHNYLHVAMCVVTDHASMDRGLRRNFFRGFYGFFCWYSRRQWTKLVSIAVLHFFMGRFPWSKLGGKWSQQKRGWIVIFFDIVFAVIHFISCCPISSVEVLVFEKGQNCQMREFLNEIKMWRSYFFHVRVHCSTIYVFKVHGILTLVYSS